MNYLIHEFRRARSLDGNSQRAAQQNAARQSDLKALRSAMRSRDNDVAQAASDELEHRYQEANNEQD